jgi:phosphate/sulfate permease
MIHANAEYNYSLVNNKFKDENETLLSSDNKGANKINSIKNNINTINKIQTNIFLLVPSVFIVSLLLGTIFYKVHHKWELSTSFYYSAQVLAGCMYDMPTELDPVSNYFSLLYFLFGTTVMAFLFGIFVSNLVRKKRNLLNKREEDFIEYESINSNKGYLRKILASPWLVDLKVRAMWSVHKDKYITVFLAFTWVGIGIRFYIIPLSCTYVYSPPPTYSLVLLYKTPTCFFD